MFCFWAAALSLLAEAGAAEPGSDAPVHPTQALSLDSVVSEVLGNHPTLGAARANWDALLARVPQARAWQDAQVGLNVLRHTEWMAGQTLPLSGRNRERARAACAEADAALADLQRRELDLIGRARAAYYRYANAYAQLDLNRQQETVLNQTAELCWEKQRTGKRTEVDALTAQADLAMLLEARLDIEREISDSQSQLNVLMNRPAQGELDPPRPLSFKPLILPRYAPPPSLHGPREGQFRFNWPLFQVEMQSRALAERPELVEAQHRIEASQAGYRYAQRAWFPDPQLRFEMRQDPDAAESRNEYVLGVAFDLPGLNFNKYRAVVREGNSRLESARCSLAALQAEALGIVRNQVKKIETLQNHYEFHRDRIVPQWQQTVQAAQTAYAADRVSILELLAPLRALREAESVLQHHLAEYWTAVAELEAVVGTSLEVPSAVEQDRP
jgi:outer membrane protein TolC